jgi:hypothetical protein
VIQRDRVGVLVRDQGQDGQAIDLVTAESFMGDLVNLRAARKRTKRQQAEQKAASNRLVHGRSKAERALQQSRSEQARKGLEQHRIGKGDAP